MHVSFQQIHSTSDIIISFKFLKIVYVTYIGDGSTIELKHNILQLGSKVCKHPKIYSDI